MKTFIIIFVSLLVLTTSKTFLKKKSKSKVACEKPFWLLNRGTIRPLYVYNIQKDDQGVARYGDVATSVDLSHYDKWCDLQDGRIQHIDTGLFLNVHGPGRVCWARDTCEWATQIDAYYVEGTSYKWEKTSSDETYYVFQAMGRALTDENDKNGYVNLEIIKEGDIYQEWIFHWQ